VGYYFAGEGGLSALLTIWCDGSKSAFLTLTKPPFTFALSMRHSVRLLRERRDDIQAVKVYKEVYK
jgi:hypothetical protein